MGNELVSSRVTCYAVTSTLFNRPWYSKRRGIDAQEGLRLDLSSGLTYAHVVGPNTAWLAPTRLPVSSSAACRKAQLNRYTRQNRSFTCRFTPRQQNVGHWMFCEAKPILHSPFIHIPFLKAYQHTAQLQGPPPVSPVAGYLPPHPRSSRPKPDLPTAIKVQSGALRAGVARTS